MKLEMRVTNLEISKKLKEIGIHQNTFFCYTDRPDDLEFLPFEVRNNNVCIAAFMASEIIDLLPHMVDTKINKPFNNFRLWMTKSFIVESMCLPKKFIYIVNYNCDTKNTLGEDAWLTRQLTKNIHDSNLANALGLMLIYLHENNLIQCNKI